LTFAVHQRSTWQKEFDHLNLAF